MVPVPEGVSPIHGQGKWQRQCGRVVLLRREEGICRDTSMNSRNGTSVCQHLFPLFAFAEDCLSPFES